MKDGEKFIAAVILTLVSYGAYVLFAWMGFPFGFWFIIFLIWFGVLRS